MIEAIDLRRCFGEYEALAGVSFVVNAGEVVGLLGPNGAGKTTCMRVLTGFLPPSGGRARVCSHEVTSERGAVAARRNIGYLPEGAPIYPEMRVAEYLAFRARLRRIGRRARHGALDRVVERCGLGDVRRRIVGQLSRGYRQRVGLADALLADPPVLILDEPTAGLDPNQIRDVQEMIRSLGQERAVLLSSHILAQVEAVCSRLLILHRGRVVARGTVDEIRETAGAAGRIEVWIRGPAAEIVERLARFEDLALLGHEVVSRDPETVRCQLRGAGGADLRERLAAVVQQAGWGLRELRGGAVLDEVFGALTGAGRQEEDPPAPAEASSETGRR